MELKPHCNKAWWLAFTVLFAAIVYLSGMGWVHAERDLAGARWELLLFLGILTWSAMTVCVAIAARWPWLNRLAGGLDKGYGLHKWLGTAALCVVLLHWATVQSWRWMVGWGWLDAHDVLQAVLAPLGAGGSFPLDPLSRLGGGAAFFLMAALVVVALVRRIPYHVFRNIHLVAPAAYLLGAVHVLNRIPREWWTTPAAYLLAGITAVGVCASVTALGQGIGRKRRVMARIETVSEESDGIVDVTVLPATPFRHRSGQFAFIDFTLDGHGSHPFSMASCNPERTRFLIKKLGDATSRLDDILQPGRTIELEGPYGRFDFSSPRRGQIWIAGGIGITPFLSRLEELAGREGPDQEITLWYSVQSEEEARFPANLAELCRRAGVTLRMVVSDRDERLTPEEAAAGIGDLAECSVWFCGPDSFKKEMERGLVKKGLLSRDFHSERFEFR